MKWIIAWCDHDNVDLNFEEFEDEESARESLEGDLADYKCLLIRGEIKEVAT